MLKGILVTIDGTSSSEAAVQLGMKWAKRADAMLAGLGIIDNDALIGTESVPIGGGAFKQERDAAMVEQERHRVEGLLSQFAVTCAEQQISCKVLEDFGSAHNQVVHESQRYDVILIGQESGVPSDRGPAPVVSVERLVRDSPRPVIVVPKWPAPEGPVMLAYDGSVQASRTLQLFQLLQPLDDTEVHVVTMAADRTDANRVAGQAVEFLQLHGIRAHVRPVDPMRSAAQMILDEAARLGAQMIAMGAYGQTALREFFMGSVTRNVLLQSRVPVFVYH